MAKSMNSVFILNLYRLCIRANRYIEQGFQGFSIKNYKEYTPHKQTQKQKQKWKSRKVVVLLYIYLLYLFKRNRIAAILWAAYTACIHVYFCIQLKRVTK